MKPAKLPISKYLFLFFLPLSVFLVFSCKKELKRQTISKQEVPKKETTTLEISSINQFPETGKYIVDFVKPPYKIQYQAEGYLNNDNLKDIVIVLQNDDKTESRPMLVLLKQLNGGYTLSEISSTAMGPEFTSDNYQIYDDESIGISNN